MLSTHKEPDNIQFIVAEDETHNRQIIYFNYCYESFPFIKPKVTIRVFVVQSKHAVQIMKLL